MPAKFRKVKSLGELRQLARDDVRYDRLLRAAASNLGGPNVYKPDLVETAKTIIGGKK